MGKINTIRYKRVFMNELNYEVGKRSLSGERLSVKLNLRRNMHGFLSSLFSNSRMSKSMT